MKALVERLTGEPFQVIGVDTGDDPDAFRKGMADFGVSWLVAYQGEATPISELYRVEAYPTIYVLDREGRIAAKNLRGEALAKKVAELLAAPAR